MSDVTELVKRLRDRADIRHWSGHSDDADFLDDIARLLTTLEARCASAPERVEAEPVAWLRDIDGTGSLHPASKGDPHAFPVYASPPAPVVTGELARKLARALDGIAQISPAEAYQALNAVLASRETGGE